MVGKLETADFKIPDNSNLTPKDYIRFIESSYGLLKRYPQYVCGSEGIETLELAHLVPTVPETVLTIYIGINEAGLVTPFLPRHAHNNVSVCSFSRLWTGSIIWVYLSDIFPNRVRAKGQSLGSTIHRVAAAIISWTIPLIADFSGGYAFAFYALCMVGQLIWVLVAMKETKEISLGEIQEKLGIS